MNQKSYFNWTEDKKYTLAKLAIRHEGYKLTDRNHQERWEIIIEKLKMKPEFAELEIQLLEESILTYAEECLEGR
jgi:hypothetical protein